MLKRGLLFLLVFIIFLENSLAQQDSCLVASEENAPIVAERILSYYSQINLPEDEIIPAALDALEVWQPENVDPNWLNFKDDIKDNIIGNVIEDNPIEKEVHAVLIRNSEQIKKVGNELNLDPRIIASVIYVEQAQHAMRFTGKLEDFISSVVGGDTLLGLAGASIGPYQLKASAVSQADSYLRDPSSEFYLGAQFENYLSEIPLNRFNSEEILDDEQKAIKAIGVILAQFQKQWKEDSNGIDISNRPDILATLFNIGFKKSIPKKNPQSGGFVYYDISGVEKNFGDRSYDWYFSDKLTSIFPKRRVIQITTSETKGSFQGITTINIDDYGIIIMGEEDPPLATYVQKVDMNGNRVFLRLLSKMSFGLCAYSNKFVNSKGEIYVYVDERDIDAETGDCVFYKLNKQGDIVKKLDVNKIDSVIENGGYEFFLDREDNLVVLPDRRINSQDIFVFNEDLEKIKSIRIEDIKSNRLFSNTIRIAFDEENNYYILFEPNNEERGVFVIAKYNKNLEFLYSFRVEIEEGEGYGRDLEIDGNNFIYFTEGTRTIKLDQNGSIVDIFFLKYDPLDTTIFQDKIYFSLGDGIEIFDLSGNKVGSLS